MMSELPKVSIHIINYNQTHFIREAIESALAQDYPNFDVVVGDDASTDGTDQVIAEYARNYPGKVIAVLNPVNLGITGNSNATLRACTGDLIAFMGGDDVLLPGKISAQAAWFAGRPERVLCGHQVEVFYEHEQRAPHPLSRYMPTGVGAETFVRDIPFGATSVMVRADRIPPHGFDETLPMVSDQMLWIDVLREDGEYGFVPGTYARYRQHGGNITHDPLANLSDVERQLANITERYPQFSSSVRWATTRRIYYDVGVQRWRRGEFGEARRKLLSAIRREPWFAKAWIRLAQTYF